MEFRKHFLGSVLALGCLLCGSGLVADNDNGENNPLAMLNRSQRKHFEVYARISKALSEKKELDLKQAFDDTYRPVRDWCAESAPKFKYESMKAGDKAKATENKRVREEWVEKSALYWDMHESCLKVVKGFETGRKSSILPEMQKLMVNEGKARAKRYPLPRREWLSQSEADSLLYRLMANQRARYQAREAQEDNERQAHQNVQQDDGEPRQGRVRNHRRGNQRNVNANQHQRRGGRQHQRRR